jgi:bacillithiol biosynthesis deacetylase BshB1
MGLSVRENLFIPDGFVELIRKYKMKVIETLRKFRPKVVLMPYEKDRHPDHGNCGKLVRDSCFLSGLHKIQTKFPPHKPSQIFYYFSLWEFEYSFIVDISAQFQRKIEAIKCFASQLYQENQSEPATMLSQPDFLELIENRARYYGYRLGVKYGEPFYSPGILKVNDLLKLETGPFTI